MIYELFFRSLTAHKETARVVLPAVVFLVEVLLIEAFLLATLPEGHSKREQKTIKMQFKIIHKIIHKIAAKADCFCS